MNPVERRPPVVTERDELAVNHRFVRQLRQTAYDPGISAAEVIVIARAEIQLAAGSKGDSAVLVDLELVRPTFGSSGRLSVRSSSIGSMKPALTRAAIRRV
jgi:hypothetical protein